MLLGGPLPTCVRYPTSRRLQSQLGQLRVRKQPHRAVSLHRVDLQFLY